MPPIGPDIHEAQGLNGTQRDDLLRDPRRVTQRISQA